MIRRITDAAFESGAPDEESDAAAIEESFGVLADEAVDADELRGVDERAGHLERMRQLEP